MWHRTPWVDSERKNWDKLADGEGGGGSINIISVNINDDRWEFPASQFQPDNLNVLLCEDLNGVRLWQWVIGYNSHDGGTGAERIYTVMYDTSSAILNYWIFDNIDTVYSAYITD